jgi:hypothetical protein
VEAKEEEKNNPDEHLLLVWVGRCAGPARGDPYVSSLFVGSVRFQQQSPGGMASP